VANFTAMAAVAKRLIDANGRTVTLIQQGSDPLDLTKPWRGQSTPVRASVSGKAVFTDTNTVNPDNAKRKRQGMLFAASNDSGLGLEDFDIVEDGSIQWKIVSVSVIGPADTRVLYKFEVTR